MNRKRIPVVSIVLVIINVLVFLLCMYKNDVIYGAGILNVQGVVLNGEYGRIIWSMFLHADEEHIFNNMMLAFFMGGMLEKEIGHIWYGVLYFLSGIAGNLLSLLVKVVQGEMIGSVGASGAIFGLDGALLALVLFSGRKMENVTPERVLLLIILSLYSGLTSEYIDNAAHIGGLLMGFMVGIIICVLRRRKMN